MKIRCLSQSVFTRSLMHQDVYMNHYIIFQISIIRLEMHKTSTERSRKHQREAGSFDPDKLIEKEH